jgi:hypothetical protein
MTTNSNPPQGIPIFRQLDAGIRALDLRYISYNGKLRLLHRMLVSKYHAFLTPDDETADDPSLGEELEDVIWGLNAWLEIHPSETIFVSLKPDQPSCQDCNTMWLMKELLNETSNFWIDTPTAVCSTYLLSPKIIGF